MVNGNCDIRGETDLLVWKAYKSDAHRAAPGYMAPAAGGVDYVGEDLNLCHKKNKFIIRSDKVLMARKKLQLPFNDNA